MVKQTKNKKSAIPSRPPVAATQRSLLASILPHHRDKSSIDLIISNSTSKSKVKSNSSASNLSSVLRSSKGRSKTSLTSRSRLSSTAVSEFPLIGSQPTMNEPPQPDLTVDTDPPKPDVADDVSPPTNTTSTTLLSSKRKKSTSKNDSGGILSSIFSAAHNAAHVISSSYEEPAQSPKPASDEPHHSTTFSGKLDSLLKPHKNRDESSSISKNSDVEGLDVPALQTSEVSSDHENLLPSSIHFSSIRESPLNTLGHGELLLSNFDQPEEADVTAKSIDKATVFQTSDNASDTNNGVGSDAGKKGRSSSFRKPPLSPNQSSEHITLTDIKRNLTPDLVNRSLPSNGQLTITGDGENKGVARKSVTGMERLDLRHDDEITIDEDSHDMSDIDSGSNAELDHIIDYKDITLANKKRNKEFHQVFKKIPQNEALIDDFSCALSKDILVQGRMYLSEHFVCFNSNILGWTTNVVIPLQEVIKIEKKSTAGLFPNGMVIRTLHHKYVFATFLSRDLTFNILISVWHRGLLEGVEVDSNQLMATAHDKRRKRGFSNSSFSKLVFSDETEGVRSTSNYSDSGISDDEMSGEMEESDGIDHDSEDGSTSSMSLKRGKKTPPVDDEGYATEDGSYNGDHSHMDDMFHKEDSKVDLKHVSSSSSTGKAQPKSGSDFYGLPNIGPATHEPTEIDYTKQPNEVFITEENIKAPLGVIYNILFGKDSSQYIKILETQKNFEILESDITGLDANSRERHYTYIKPLNGPIGPKQTKCFIVDKLTEFEMKKYVLVEQITSTPDVPSGNSFQVKTKIFLSWGENNSTTIYVVTMVEWSGKSWIKGAIEKGSIDGQKLSMKTLVDTINEIIDDARSKSGGKSRRNTTAGKRRKTIRKNKKQAEDISAGAQAPAANESLSSQVTKLISSIGKIIPVEIPFAGDLIKGIIVLFLSFLVVMRVWNWLFGYTRAQPYMIQDQVVTRLSTRDHQFIVIPRPESYLQSQQQKMREEMRLWEWLNDRSDGKIRVKEDGMKKDKAKSKAAAEIQHEDFLHEYSNQEMKEIVKITRMKLDEINKQLA